MLKKANDAASISSMILRAFCDAMRDYNSTMRFRQKIWAAFPLLRWDCSGKKDSPRRNQPGCQTFWSLPDLEFQILEKSLRSGVLPISIQSSNLSRSCVPVVQRREQGFPEIFV